MEGGECVGGINAWGADLLEVDFWGINIKGQFNCE